MKAAKCYKRMRIEQLQRKQDNEGEEGHHNLPWRGAPWTVIPITVTPWGPLSWPPSNSPFPLLPESL